MKKLMALFVAVLAVTPVFAQNKKGEDQKLNFELVYALSRQNFLKIAAMRGGAEFLKNNGFPSVVDVADSDKKYIENIQDNHKNYSNYVSEKVTAARDSMNQRLKESRFWNASSVNKQNEQARDRIQTLQNSLRNDEEFTENYIKGIAEWAVNSVYKKNCSVVSKSFDAKTGVLTMRTDCRVPETLSFGGISTEKARILYPYLGDTKMYEFSPVAKIEKDGVVFNFNMNMQAEETK